MEFSVMMSTFGDQADVDTFERLATATERNEFDALWAGDHVVLPADIPHNYPFSPEGEPPGVIDSSEDAYELFEVLSYVAGVTDALNVGANVCISPYRHPVLLTKLAFTLEALTDGRFDFGVATGWLTTEFEVLDVPYEERGPRTDEFLELFHEARESGECSFDGEFHSFQRTGFHPMPDPGRPYIWVGGNSGASFRRLAEYGDGWTAVGIGPNGVADGRERIMRAWDDYDRAGTPDTAVMRPVNLDAERAGSERPLVGSADEVLADVEAYAEAGATRIVLNFFTTDPAEQLDQIQAFGEEILQSF
jgi:probable F420-dependent oxidoreductase